MRDVVYDAGVLRFIIMFFFYGISRNIIPSADNNNNYYFGKLVRQFFEQSKLSRKSFVSVLAKGLRRSFARDEMWSPSG